MRGRVSIHITALGRDAGTPRYPDTGTHRCPDTSEAGRKCGFADPKPSPEPEAHNPLVSGALAPETEAER